MNHRLILINHFLFSCYTGLRFSDLATLTYKNILILQKSAQPEYRLQYQMSKTGKQMNVMLCQRALKMIDIKNVGSDVMVFDLISSTDLAKSSDKLAMKIESANALANKRLKVIYQEAGIKDHLSFHCARHTFFCIALELGVDLMSLKELGGHSDLKVTQEYLKVTDTRKNEAMSKFDSI
ncbi:MAG: integrase catalytic domain-containing protein [Saprospiraceae bacterium]|nr:integrase catalytic domain-containing protein [Saprospiraceae bacterium]